MNIHDLIRELRESAQTKIVLLVADGLGGLPMDANGKTELESARTPNLDTVTREGICGLSTPVLPGITPGSGPGHLGLFGYDPLQYRIGRGILEALGINFQVGPRDVAVRGNFCTVDAKGVITDRRAGRPTTECCGYVPAAAAIKNPASRFRRAGSRASLCGRLPRRRVGRAVNDTDPQQTGHAPEGQRGPKSENTAASTRSPPRLARF